MRCCFCYSIHSTTKISTQNQHKVTHFQQLLSQLSLILLYIHKLQLKTAIARENYDLLTLPKEGIAKVRRERIGQSHGPHNVEYRIHTNGTVMVYVSCSYKPFRLVGEDDILKIMMFLSRVEDRLKVLLGDNRDDVVPSVLEWILKACDVNKDIEIDNMAQLSLPDIQISLAEKAFRGYVKLIGEKAYYRIEQPCTPNETVPTALGTLRVDNPRKYKCKAPLMSYEGVLFILLDISEIEHLQAISFSQVKRAFLGLLFKNLFS